MQSFLKLKPVSNHKKKIFMLLCRIGNQIKTQLMIREIFMNDTLKAFEEAAYRLAKAQAKKRVIERSLNGIIEELDRRAATKAAALKARELEVSPMQNLP
jgi:hypothetical protein